MDSGRQVGHGELVRNQVAVVGKVELVVDNFLLGFQCHSQVIVNFVYGESIVNVPLPSEPEDIVNPVRPLQRERGLFTPTASQQLLPAAAV